MRTLAESPASMPAVDRTEPRPPEPQPGEVSRRPGSGGTSRAESLDGLRGLASLIVVLHHCSLVLPSIARQYTDPAAAIAPGAVDWWLLNTPLRLFTAGGEAVMLFFVLSGFVLMLPQLAPRPFDWLAFYPRRVVRIGLPVAAAAVFALILATLVPQDPAATGSEWVRVFSIAAPDWTSVVRAIDLVDGDYLLDNPLWSIRWEMIFSFALPLVVASVALVRRAWVWIPASIAVCWIGISAQSEFFRYLPAFVLGAVLAVNHQRIATRIAALRHPNVFWAVVVPVAVLLALAPWLIRPWAAFGTPISIALSAIVAPATGIVVLAFLLWGPLRRIGRTAVVQWLGRISFSLYLVHVPVLFALLNLTHGIPFLVLLPLTLATSLAIATAFTRWVEMPAHRLSRRVGRLVGERVGEGLARTGRS